MSLFAVLVPVLVALAGGALLLVLTRREHWPRLFRLAAALALGPGLGFGLISLAYFFWVFAGYPPPNRWVLLGSALVLAFLLVAATRRPRGDRAGIWELFLGSSRLARFIALALVVINLGLLLASFPQISECRRHGSWDATAIWNVRALTLSRADGELSGTFAEMRNLVHPDYPLLLPAALAAQYALLGREDMAIPQITGFLFALALGAAVFFAAARVGSVTAGAAAAAVLWATPNFWRWAFAQCADVPLAYFLVIAAVAVSSQLGDRQSGRLPPSLAGLFLGLLAWTKNEGLVLALILGAAVLGLQVWVHGRDRTRWSRMAWVVAGALPALLALVLFKLYWAPVDDVGRFLDGSLSRALEIERWRTVALGFWNEVNPVTGRAQWGLMWPFLGICGILIGRYRSESGAAVLFLWWAVPAAYVCYFGIYLVTPYSLEWHLDTSVNRLLLQLLPLTLVWASSWVAPRASPTC